MDAREQYERLVAIKAAWPAQNSAPDCPHRARLHEWLRVHFAAQPRGSRVLDVGCDDPVVGRSLWPEGVEYVGLDPGGAPGCVKGRAEALPFEPASFDVVAFVTSLDHILDYRVALREAARVLVPDGTLDVVSLVWPDPDRCDLATDGVHWHHFSPSQVPLAVGALGGFMASYSTEPWKDDRHRYVAHWRFAMPGGRR